MARPPHPRNWTDETMATLLTSEATPDAAASLLLSAALWPEDAALLPYCGCAHEFDGLTDAGLETSYLGVMIAPGAKYGRAGIGVCWGGGGMVPSTTYHVLYGATSGANPQDEMREITPSFKNATYGSAWTSYGPLNNVHTTSDNQNDNPTFAEPRRFELLTQGTPYVEAISVSVVSSFSFAVSHQIPDLESL